MLIHTIQIHILFIRTHTHTHVLKKVEHVGKACKLIIVIKHWKSPTHMGMGQNSILWVKQS